MKLRIFCFVFISIVFFLNGFAHISDVIYDDSQVLEFYLTFHQENFWELLYENYNNGAEEYIPADFEFNGELFENVGVRFKGFSSMNSYPTEKKPFKIKFDEFVEDQEFYGVTKINLGNNFKDPTFLREKLFYDIANKYIPSARANFAKLFINGEYWGLYTNVEQINMKFIEKNFGESEDGNLFKGDPHGTLEWLGDNPEAYYGNYELKTNEEENDWSDLVNFIDVINNSSAEDFSANLQEVFHVQNFLFFSALNNLFVNLDSYFGSGHNYYVYHRSDTDKFIHIPWDCNETFANFTWNMNPYQLMHLPIFWENPPNQPRPLITRIFDNEELRDLYLMDYQFILENEFREDILFPRIDELANLIRPAVYEDTLKMFSNELFEQNLEEDIQFMNGIIFGLKSFITARRNIIEDQLAGFNIEDRTEGLFINEFMAKNESVIADENGDYEDWVEIYNANDFSVNLEGLFLTDDAQTPDKWQFPNIEIPAGSFLLIWTDNDEEDGELHTNFKLSASGEYLAIYNRDAIIPVDSLTFGEQEEDISYGRFPDGSEQWEFFENPTPGNANSFTSFDNEFVHDNYFEISLFPNPVSEKCKFVFYSAKNEPNNANVSLKIYNAKGQLVQTLLEDEKIENNSLVWNRGNICSGVYFYQLKTDGISIVKKMILK